MIIDRLISWFRLKYHPALVKAPLMEKYLVYKWIGYKMILLGKIKVFCQHWDYTRDLLFLTKPRQVGWRLKVARHLVVDPGQDLHQIQFSLEPFQHFTQRLNEPGAVVCVPPGVIACRWIEFRFRGHRHEQGTVTWCCYLELWSMHTGSLPPQESSLSLALPQHQSRSSHHHPGTNHDMPEIRDVLIWIITEGTAEWVDQREKLTCMKKSFGFPTKVGHLSPLK